jgi:hypothetical protein
MAWRLLVKKFQRKDTHNLIDDRNEYGKTFCCILKSFYTVRLQSILPVFGNNSMIVETV